jgi:hypothetical protein
MVLYAYVYIYAYEYIYIYTYIYTHVYGETKCNCDNGYVRGDYGEAWEEKRVNNIEMHCICIWRCYNENALKLLNNREAGW